MPAIILHHYPLSPYSEKARLAMGVKGLSWSSVEIPVWTPRPKLTPMTGGYRRTPILQIGADFYCDTLLILRVLEQQSNVGSLYPSGQEGVAKAFGWWIERGSFANAICLTCSNLGGKLPQELVDERRSFFPFSIEPSDLLPDRAKYLQRFNAHIAWLAEVLADGRKFVLGANPSAADLSAFHPIWFAHKNGGKEITDTLSFSSIVGPWYERVAAIGHGRTVDMTPDQAIEAARAAEPRDVDEWAAEGQDVGLRRGDRVSVTPDDYGNAVVGKLLAWKSDEIVIRHEDPSVGRVNLHFPRVGFDVLPERKLAA